MAKNEAKVEKTEKPRRQDKMDDVLRQPAEILFASELAALEKADRGERPAGWRLSPRAVETYLLGGKAGDLAITPKYVGNQRLVQIAIATLATDRALLLVGEPGTAKSWLSEHLTAAVCGDSLMLVQGTAGTTEEQIRYSWNYALLLAEGPSEPVRDVRLPAAVRADDRGDAGEDLDLGPVDEGLEAEQGDR